MSNPNQPPVASNQEGSSAQPSAIVAEDAGQLNILVISPEELTAITKLLLHPGVAATESIRYGGRFQLVHLSVFFLISNDAKKNNKTLEDYGYDCIKQVYDFKNSVACALVLARGFDPLKFVNDEKVRLVDRYHKTTSLAMKKAFFLEYQFIQELEDYLNHDVFKPFAEDYIALSCHLDYRNSIDEQRGIAILTTGVQKIYWEIVDYMFDFFSRQINKYMEKRAPNKQSSSEKKFYQARKDYYMSQEFTSTNQTIVAYCYHILAAYIQQFASKEPKLMLLVFTDLRKLKIRLQGNARELNQAAAKALEEAEYKTLTAVLGLDQWKTQDQNIFADANQPPKPSNKEESSEQPSGESSGIASGVISQEDAREISVLHQVLLRPDEGSTQRQKYNRKFHLVHLTVFFLISDDAHKRGMTNLDVYQFKYRSLMQLFNFQNNPAYKELFDIGYDPATYIAKQKIKLAIDCVRSINLDEKKSAFLTFKFIEKLGDFMSHPIFKPFAIEFIAMSHILNQRDEAAVRLGMHGDSELQQLHNDLFTWVPEYFSFTVSRYLMQRVPENQCSNEEKFFQARFRNHLIVVNTYSLAFSPNLLLSIIVICDKGITTKGFF